MPKKKAVKSIIAVIVIIAIGTCGYLGYKKFIAKPNREMSAFAHNSLTERVTKQDMQETITASGSVLLDDEIEVYAEGETNKIKTILVEEGDMVEAGQLLAEYDVEDTKEELENKIRDLKRDIQNAQLNIESTILPTSDDEITKLENEVTKAEKNLYDAQVSLYNYDTKITQQQTTIDNAKRDMEKALKEYEDNAKLLEVGGVSQSEYDESGDSYKKAQDTYNQALDSMEEIKKEQQSAGLNIKTLENSVTEAKNSLEKAKDIFSDDATKIKYEQQKLTLEGLQVSLSVYQKDLEELVYYTYSDVSGKVTEVCVDEGTFTEENTVILKIADFDNLIVSANIEEYDAPNIEEGQRVEMTSDGLEDKVYTGTVRKVDPSASSATSMMGTETVVPIEITVDNPDGVLKPNYSLDLEIMVVDRSDVLAVSASAVGHDADTGEYYVYKAESDKTVKKTVIDVGQYGEVSVEILSGINEGDEIVTSITDDIKDGMTIDELRTLSAANQTQSGKQNGGNEDDRNQGFNQMLQPGGAGGNRAGGGMPPGM